MVEMGDVLWHRLRHNDGQIGMRRPLISFELGEQGVRPGFGSLRFPENLSAKLAGLIADVLEYVATELALGDRLDEVERELSAQLMFECQLQRFSLGLLGTLLRLSLETLDLSYKFSDFIVAVLHL